MPAIAANTRLSISLPAGQFLIISGSGTVQIAPPYDAGVDGVPRTLGSAALTLGPYRIAEAVYIETGATGAFYTTTDGSVSPLTNTEAAAVRTSVMGIGKVRRLLLVGDSLNARMGDAFTALGGWAKTVNSITPSGSDFLDIGFSASHTIPVGSRVRFVADSTVDAGLRNRWFNFTSTGAATGRLTVPTDAYDRTNLVELVRAATVFSSTALLQIDSVQGSAGSWTFTQFELGQPFDELVNLCIPGARAGGALRTDLRAVIDSVDLTQFSCVGITCGINDMAQSLPAADALAGLIYAANRATEAGCLVVIDDVYSQGTMDSAKQAFLSVVNNGLRAWAEDRERVILVPTHSIINDPAANTGSTVDLSDGTHLNATGCTKIGAARARLMAPAVKPRVAPVLPLGAVNYLTNGTMAGTAGTHTTPGSGAGQSQGEVATSWFIPTPGANVTATTRKQRGQPRLWRPGAVYALGDVVLPTITTPFWYVVTTAGTAGASAPTWGTTAWGTTTDNTVTWTAVPPLENLSSRSEWQYLQASVGATVTAQERLTLQQDITLATVGLAAGDWVRGWARVVMLDSNWRNFMLGVRSTSSIGGLIAYSGDGVKNSFVDPANQPAKDARGVLRSPWWQIPAGVTSISFYIELGHGTGSANSILRAFVNDCFLEKMQ